MKELSNKKYNHSNTIVYTNQFHIIFCPKYRKKVLINEIKDELEMIINNLSKELDFEIKSMNIMPDHVHLFLSFHPKKHIHLIIKAIKGRSSRILREKYPSLKSRIPSLWSRSYFSCSVGHVNEDTVQKYIENQKK